MIKKHIIDITRIASGVLMLITSLYTYIPYAQCMYQMTFIVNMTGALLFITGGILGIARKKSIPGVLYLMHAVAISLVFLITETATVLGMMNFNLDDRAMVFLHIINPIISISFYLGSENKEPFSLKSILISPMFFLSYLVFDYTRFLIKHKFVYGLFSKDNMTFMKAVTIGVSAYIVSAIIGFVFHAIRCGFRLGKKARKRTSLEIVEVIENIESLATN